MRKLLLSILTISLLGLGANAQNVYIPDANFKAYLVGNTALNTNSDTAIQVSEAEAYASQLVIFSMSISDLTGIEAFPKITHLKCYNNTITSLDLSQNTKLVYLSCNVNLLTELDLSNNPLINHLECNNNLLTSLDLSNNPALKFLFTYNMPTLTSLNMASGGNTNFNVFNSTNCPNLKCIQVDDTAYSNTNWTGIDTASSFSLSCNWCTVDIPDANFKAYLVGKTAINTNNDSEIQCAEASAFTGNISLWGLGITDLTGIEAFTSLQVLWCGNNSLTTLDVSKNAALTSFYCTDNDLTSLNITGCSLITELRCYNNKLTSLDVSTNSSLKILNCYNNKFDSLNTSSNDSLEMLYCSINSLDKLDVSNNINLVELVCGQNDLTVLDVSSNLKLTKLHCSWNEISNIDVSINTALDIFNCYNNLLSALNLANGNNLNMSRVSIYNNPNLNCVQVDDTAYSNTNWTSKDSIASFSLNCGNVGIGEIEKLVFSIYPNPTKNILRIETEGLEVTSISIMDIRGKLVKKVDSVLKEIDVSDLPNGIYFLQVQSDFGIGTKKFIKE